MVLIVTYCLYGLLKSPLQLIYWIVIKKNFQFCGEMCHCFSHPKCPASTLEILLSLQYFSNYIAKIIQSRWGQCTHTNISQNCVSKCTRLHLSAYISKFLVGACPRTPLGSSWLSGLHPQTIEPCFNINKFWDSQHNTTLKRAPKTCDLYCNNSDK